MNPFEENPEEQSPTGAASDLNSSPAEGATEPVPAVDAPVETEQGPEVVDIPELVGVDPAFAGDVTEEALPETAEVIEEAVRMEGEQESLTEAAVAAAGLSEATLTEAVVAEGSLDADSPSADTPEEASADISEDDAAVSAEGSGAETAEEPVPPGPDPNKIPGQDENPLMNWFIIHTYSGFENKVSESLRSRSEAFGFDKRVGQILIPTEEVVEMRNGKKVTSKRLLYPGYVLVQMEMDDDLWHQVKNTPRVTGFVGGGGQPVPLTATEVNSILYRQTEAAERPRPKLSYEKNETVRIIDGPFANFQGKVDEINSERNTLRVMVTIFGRSTPVELDFLQVEKMA